MYCSIFLLECTVNLLHYLGASESTYNTTTSLLQVDNQSSRAVPDFYGDACLRICIQTKNVPKRVSSYVAPVHLTFKIFHTKNLLLSINGSTYLHITSLLMVYPIVLTSPMKCMYFEPLLEEGEAEIILLDK